MPVGDNSYSASSLTSCFGIRYLGKQGIPCILGPSLHSIHVSAIHCCCNVPLGDVLTEFSPTWTSRESLLWAGDVAAVAVTAATTGVSWCSVADARACTPSLMLPLTYAATAAVVPSCVDSS